MADGDDTSTDSVLSVETLRAYLDSRSANESSLDAAVLEDVLAAAIRFCELYVGEVAPGFKLVAPVDPAVADAVLFDASRRYRERDAAYSNTGQTVTDEPDITYWRAMPQRVKTTYDLLRAQYSTFLRIA